MVDGGRAARSKVLFLGPWLVADGGRAADEVLVQEVDHGVEEDLGLWRTAAGGRRIRSWSRQSTTASRRTSACGGRRQQGGG